MDEVFRITDPQVLKVVAHPLRVRMLGLLRSDGPATASELARRVGESSGSTSYHLRELAKYGFIEEDPSPDGRERRWRARHRYTSWDNAQMARTPEGRESVRIMHLRQVESLARAMEGLDLNAWSSEWVEVSGMADHLMRLTPAAVRELELRFEALVEEFRARYDDDPEARPVQVWTAAIPRGDET
ncbi:winged helix-turn-helix domain-containing protein [Nonomuraea sediminis]|uniref:winged helix-turn-helix domain-containing protein n=1 Tax=Nonomuraea sediminis TaxID=2835864 RepID=UPI001BDBB4DD|nr:helix-turn-helix domain-containing protein [Nonomuraea sediminis]